MPRKGYDSITLKDDEVQTIDKIVDKNQPHLKNRSRVVMTAVNTHFSEDLEDNQ